jgi:hypothetical protein
VNNLNNGASMQFGADKQPMGGDRETLNREVFKDNVISTQPGVRVSNVGTAFRMSVGPDGNASAVSEGPATSTVQMADYGNGLDSVLGTLQRNGTTVSPSEMRDGAGADHFASKHLTRAARGVH